MGNSAKQSSCVSIFFILISDNYFISSFTSNHLYFLHSSFTAGMGSKVCSYWRHTHISVWPHLSYLPILFLFFCLLKIKKKKKFTWKSAEIVSPTKEILNYLTQIPSYLLEFLSRSQRAFSLPKTKEVILSSF